VWISSTFNERIEYAKKGFFPPSLSFSFGKREGERGERPFIK